MTARIEKTVFISYRRTNLPWALAIYQELTHNGYDVFFDYLSIPSGDFENIIVENIRARTHFVVILTPSALERCNEPGDWLRREIETAMDEKRNVVPLMLESFDFGSSSIVNALTGKLEYLKRYNGLRVHSEYFFEGMDRLRKQFLNVSLESVIHPISEKAKPIVEAHQTAASEVAPVTEKQLTAQTWLERGYTFDKEKNFDEAIRCYSVAISLEPNYSDLYVMRGLARNEISDFFEAIKDFSEAISLDPNSTFLPRILFNRGYAQYRNGDLDEAMQDYSEVIRLEPDFPDIFYSIGDVLREKGDLDEAIKNYTEAIRINPDLSEAYYGRGVARHSKGDLGDAIADYDKSISLKPDYSPAYIDRGIAHRANGDLDGAITDYTKAIQIEPNEAKAYNNRGYAYSLKKELDRAIEDYSRSIELRNMNLHIPYRNRANAHQGKGDLEKAIKDYSEALRIKPNFMDIYFERGTVWELIKNYQYAISDYKKYLELGGEGKLASKKEVEEKIRKLKSKLTKKEPVKKKKSTKKSLSKKPK